MSAVPKLRFKEFEGDWETTRFDDVFHISAGGDIDRETVSELQTKLHPTPVFANALKHDGLYGFTSERPKVTEKSITVTGRGDVGHAKARQISYTPIVRLLVLRPKIKTDVGFWEHRINTTKIFVESTGVPQLTGPQLSSYKTSFPTLPEQKKIADFLGAVDDKIAGLRAREALLSQYKQGVMQKIFSQALRFKQEARSAKGATGTHKSDDGRDFPDWEDIKLGSHATFKKGKGISKADISEIGLSKCIRYGELYTEYDEVIEKVVSRTNQQVSNSVISQPNDLLMPTSDVTPTGLATASALNEEGVILGGDILIMRSKTILNMFFAFWVAANKKAVMRLISGSTVFHLYGSDMEKIKMSLPHWEEQQKIADFLSAIDNKISIVSAQITQMQDFKKGLLQQMFV